VTAGALARTMLRDHRGAMVVVLAAHLAAAAAGVAGPPLLGAALDRITEGRSVTIVLAAFVAVVVVGSVLAAAASRASARFSEELLADLRRRVADAIAGRSVTAVEQAGTGDLLTRATADVEAIAIALRQGLPWLLVAGLTVTLTSVVLVVVAPVLGAVALAGAAVAAPPFGWYLRRCGPIYGAEREANGRRIRSFHDAAVTASLVRAYGRTDDRQRQQLHADQRWFRAAMMGARVRIVARSGVTVGVAVALGGVVAIGAAGVDRGSMTVGAVTAAVLYLLRVVEPIEVLIHQLDELQTARAAASRVAELAGQAPSPEGEQATARPRPDGGSLRAAGLRFAYVPGHPVLHDVDLEVGAGEHVALVGPSGAGKSTLARLLAGVHHPERGTVTVGGVDLRRLDAAALRRWIVVIEQEDHVFAGCLADNLRLVAPDAADGALLAALQAVGASWVDDLPGGLHAVPRLSPVQARQLALARVLLVDPPVVVLDEATAGFEAGSARTAESGLDAALAGRTVVSVSHRLDTARRADRIVLVADGRIVECGSHEDLVAAGGDYAALWQPWITPV
jgi:ABC-type multidrug transport system fused ATPase/permease subunit